MSDVFSNGVRTRLKEARLTDPTPVLCSYGFKVKWDRNAIHAEVFDLCGDEAYRLTNHNGKFICCDHYGEKVGQYSTSIDLIMDVDPTLNLNQAISLLLGTEPPPYRASLTPNHANPPKIKLPPVSGIDVGREYLINERGISKEVVALAEESGFIRYCASGVMALGYGALGEVRSVTIRNVAPDASVKKRNLAGSSKYFPQMLKGVPKTVLIVEGFVDALAAWTINLRERKELPTVIVSNGAGTISFVQNPLIQNIFFAAEQVFICDENEKDQAAQERTDALHDRQRTEIANLIGTDCVKRFKIKGPSKDLADFNLALVNSLKIKRGLD